MHRRDAMKSLCAPALATMAAGFTSGCSRGPMTDPVPGWSVTEGNRRLLPEPEQIDLPSPEGLQTRFPGQIMALAKFRIRAVVLGSERYRMDRFSTWCPVDLALGWGLLGTPVVREAIKFTQGGRWFMFWIDRSLGMQTSFIGGISANMHIVPATEEVEDVVLGLGRGDETEIQGYLISIQDKDGWRTSSSRLRTDTGPGACEVIYATYAMNARNGKVATQKVLFPSGTG